MAIATNISVIILTYNEGENICQALDSVFGWAKTIFLLDSGSTDQTLEIASKYGCVILQNTFENYSKQRNFALDNFPILTDSTFFLDADEWVPNELKNEISSIISNNPKTNGFYIKRKFIWMGKWVRRGIYPTWILRLFRNKTGRCENRPINEHLLIDGPCGYLKNDFIHEDKKGVSDWLVKHDKYAELEANELLKAIDKKNIDTNLMGTQAERKRWLRYKIWNRLPPMIRPFFYFFYRYFLQLGFLDGKEGLAYHFLHALWYPMMIDIKFIEMKMNNPKNLN